jgi:hypothetical protein
MLESLPSTAFLFRCNAKLDHIRFQDGIARQQSAFVFVVDDSAQPEKDLWAFVPIADSTCVACDRIAALLHRVQAEFRRNSALVHWRQSIGRG